MKEKKNRTEAAKCRGCGRQLIGKPYHLGGTAYDPETGDRVPKNFYGGYVCSEQCDINVCLRMSSSIPGAGPAKWLNSAEALKVRYNWRK